MNELAAFLLASRIPHDHNPRPLAGRATMSPEAQRIAIAESLGWRWTDSRELPYGAEQFLKKWHSPEGACGQAIFPPEYTSDLNAMHTAEAALTHDQQDDFTYELGEIAAPITGEEWLKVHATAAQRAEAYLRTIGKWQDEKDNKKSRARSARKRGLARKRET